MGKFVAALTVFLLVVPGWGKTLTVDDDGPADYQTIQAAIDHSSGGDTIVVRPGTYGEKVAFGGRRVTVRSEDPGNPAVVSATVIRAESVASVVFDAGERQDSVLTGFTISEYGILCLGASPTITGNVIRNCTGVGIRGQSNASPTITENQILSNRLEAVYSCQGLIQGNVISGNSAGIAFCNGPIRNNVISDSTGGGGIYACNGEIAGNRIVGNYAATDGGGLYGCNGPIHHNIIAGNRAERSGGGLFNCTETIHSNTIVGNRATQTGGAIFNCPKALHDNIIAHNEAQQGGGICGPASSSYNLFWLNTPQHFANGATAGVGDVVGDPLFVVASYWDDKGTTDRRDDVWIDGDYHLKSQAGRWSPEFRQWMMDKVTSQGIDAGRPSSNWSAELWPHGKRINVGAYGGTAEASMSLANLGHLADLDHDERIGPRDLAVLAEQWPVQADLLAQDLNRDGLVDGYDFAVLGMQWRSGPPPATPPLPNPMTWAIEPYATGPRSVAMVATTATSTDGTDVEYYFEDYFYPTINSGWLHFGPGADPCWVDTTAQPETANWYRVKARNRGNRLETLWSERKAVITPADDSKPPTPDPMTWQAEPYVVSPGTIRMIATTAADVSGVQYQFECTSHPAYSSGWQDTSTYEVTSVPSGYYRFRVRARDKSPKQNMTEWSQEATVDLKPPTPDPMKWEVQPEEINIGGGWNDYYATMTAVEATDDSGVVEYYFECTSESGFSSGWQTSREYTVRVGRQNLAYRFRVRARDKYGNRTGWSEEWPAR
jgi:parallel beta-helix repeat protein